MRQLATLPHDQANLLADHLLTLQIATRLDDEPGGVAVWVCDEDHVPRARQELAAFQQSPTDARYRAASKAAGAIRARADAEDAEYARQQRQFSDRVRQPGAAGAPALWTVVLLTLSVIVGVATQLGAEKKSPVLRALRIAQMTPEGDRFDRGEGLSAITERGEVWRLVTPILIHFDPLHLVFNMLWLILLGQAIEGRIGSGAFLGLVLLIAVPSNLAQAFFQFGLNVQGVVSFGLYPWFGGMSGVVYGLFGYQWVRSWVAEVPELVLSRSTVFMMLLWLVFCILGAVGNVANTAHVVGMLVGMGTAWVVNRFAG
jgi:GlpG protein